MAVDLRISQRRYALIGAAGYIAPRHMKAIRSTNGTLVAALDKNDSVGIIDSYFPDAHFFTEFERFDRHLDKLRRGGSADAVNFVSICSPNYLHDSHIRFALRSGADAICEKPLVLNPWNIDALSTLERDTGRRVWTILQLRVHPNIIALRERLASSLGSSSHDVTLTYITSRGRWYLQSWKGDEKKSGGLATNIGIHFFDMLHFVFGELNHVEVHEKSEERVAGLLEFDRAHVRWFLSVSSDDLPESARAKGQRAYRSMTVDGQEVEFSDGFGDLHTQVYSDIVDGRGYGLDEARTAVDIAARIRASSPRTLSADDRHPSLITAYRSL